MVGSGISGISMSSRLGMASFMHSIEELPNTVVKAFWSSADRSVAWSPSAIARSASSERPESCRAAARQLAALPAASPSLPF